MPNRKIWIPLVPSGFYWLCNWINCVLVEYQSKQVNCFLPDGNKNFLLDCRGYKRPPPVKNSFVPGNYFVQCNGFFFFFLFRTFVSKIKHKPFSWSQKSKIFTWITFYKDEQGKSKQKKRYVFYGFPFLLFLRNIDSYRNCSISCLHSKDTSLLSIFTPFSNKFKRWKVWWLKQGVSAVDERCRKSKRKVEKTTMESTSKEKPRNL